MLQNTHALIDHICRTLLAAETRRLRKVIDKLIDENQQAYDSKLDGLAPRGSIVACSIQDPIAERSDQANRLGDGHKLRR